jgi:YfiH family protein
VQDNRIGDIELLSYLRFEAHRGVTNVVTTRAGGRSGGAYESLNLGLHVGDDPDAVLENRALLAQALAIEPESFTLAQQIHKTKIVVVKSPHGGRGAVEEGDALDRADAMITRIPDIPLMVLVADCVAVSLYDTERDAIGLAHAGWQGTLGRIAELTVKKMELMFDSDPKDLIVGLSPAIGQDHYTVGEDVASAYREEFGDLGDGGEAELMRGGEDDTFSLDLPGINEWQLRRCGVPPENVELSGLCTACHPDRFYSHRLDNGATGRFGNIVMLHASNRRQY